MRLRARLTLAFALVAAIPLATMQVVASRQVRSEFRRTVAAEFEGARRLVASRFVAVGDRLVEQVRAAEASIGLRRGLFEYTAATERRAQSNLIAAVELAASEADLQLLLLYADDGTLLACAHEPARFDMLDARVWEQARAHKSTSILAREDGIEVRGLALKALLPADEELGVYLLAGGTLIDEGFLRSLPVADQLAFLVVTSDGLQTAPTMASHDAVALLARASRRPGHSREVLEAANWQVGEIVLEGIAIEEPVELLLATSLAPLQAKLSKLQRTFAGLLVGGLLIAWALAYAISRRWTDPIERLVVGLERVAQGELSFRVGIEGADEFGRLGRAFDSMAADLAASREQLLQAERVAAWRDIARRLAHEIKNPLSPIALSMETLRRSHAVGREDFPELLSECTQTVLEEVERLRKIVQSFSDFARLPRPQLVREGLHDVVRGVLQLHAGHSDGYAFESDLEAGDGVCVFDIDQMNRALVNLVQNAMEAMPGGGRVTIATRSDTATGRFLVTIADSGPGVSEEQARDLFRPYHTNKPGGTGLGLAIVHRIMSEHHGSVRLVNPGGAGAVFELSLPLELEDSAAEGGDEADQAVVPGALR